MGTKKLKVHEREAYKKLLGIRSFEKNQRKCGTCFNYNHNLCSVHHLVTKAIEVCDAFSARQIKVIRGGSVSPK